MRHAGLWLLAALAVSGCEKSATPVAPEISRAGQCLNSFKIELKDPDSAAVVADLGRRDFPDDSFKDTFFLRYKAKNSFGAYISKNVLCGKWGDEYRRDETVEFIAVQKVANRCLEDQVAKMWAGRSTNKVDCDAFGSQFVLEMVDSFKVAEQMSY